MAERREHVAPVLGKWNVRAVVRGWGHTPRLGDSSSWRGKWSRIANMHRALRAPGLPSQHGSGLVHRTAGYQELLANADPWDPPQTY